MDDATVIQILCWLYAATVICAIAFFVWLHYRWKKLSLEYLKLQKDFTMTKDILFEMTREKSTNTERRVTNTDTKWVGH